ncbi:hypothetical protein HO173_002282 [Letharia columbiana]|uniref:Uncharacterized protein n=1 Tax=Letharia columbiana TaxID=112416 RepID=A0A8H6L8J5_9LECA|nr:uncharacterized protein HO173_002282 [Letharia columbiana]KAF6239736.1 hypothetical protein HO173_002282 [Letharia columbiana]
MPPRMPKKLHRCRLHPSQKLALNLPTPRLPGRSAALGPDRHVDTDDRHPHRSVPATYKIPIGRPMVYAAMYRQIWAMHRCESVLAKTRARQETSPGFGATL